MALPSSGKISLNDFRVELGTSGQISFNDAVVRDLIGKAAGDPASMSEYYGASAVPPLFEATITSNQQNLNLRAWALANGWDGSVEASITVNSGVEITSSSTSTPAMLVDGSWPAGVSVVNNGNIIGRGGRGGWAGAWYADSTACGQNINDEYAGEAGGTAFKATVACTVNNSGVIGGGGGGGGAGETSYIAVAPYACGPPVASFGLSAGSGGGGGAGYGTKGRYGEHYVGALPALGSTSNQCAGVGTTASSQDDAGTGGLTTGGAGGTVQSAGSPCGNASGGAGGAGGGLGSAGAAGGTGTPYSGVAATAGGAGGKSVEGNAYITWAATGTRHGSVI